MAVKFIDEIDLAGKKVIARFDFNVPLAKDGSKKITDTTRVDRALETIKYILDNGASKLVLMSHLGRPKGKVNKDFSLEPVANYLAEKLGIDVTLTESCTDAAIKTLLNLSEPKIVLLENLRFHSEETDNDRDFANTLSSYGDIYVNDAFGTAHRKHASTYEINAFFKGSAVGGFLLKKEIEALSKVTEHPKKPFVAIMGGVKVADKIKILEKLVIIVDKLFVGGAMAYPFLKAKGHEIGSSLCSDDDIILAKKILKSSSSSKIILPIDHIVADNPESKGEIIDSINIPDGKMALDIGPATLEIFKNSLRDAKTILWNGPMGYFESSEFAKGSMEVAKILSETDGFTIVGGGDSVSAVNKSGLAEKMSHVSTGGGASLEYIENGTLPGIQALKFGIK